MIEFKKEEDGTILRVQCPAVLDAYAAQSFKGVAKSWMMTKNRIFVLDMDGVRLMGREFYKEAIELKTTLKRDGKSLYSINLTPAILRQVIDAGLEKVFQPVKSVEDVLPVKSGMVLDAELINPFLKATHKIFEVQCKIKITAGKPFKKNGEIVGTAIAGILSLNSPSYNGNIVLAMPSKLFFKIFLNMFEEAITEIGPDSKDVAGEILNMIYGAAKIELNQKGFRFDMALPGVALPEEFKARASAHWPAVIVPFDTDFGTFQIEFEVNKGVTHV